MDGSDDRELNSEEGAEMLEPAFPPKSDSSAEQVSEGEDEGRPRRGEGRRAPLGHPCGCCSS